MAVLKYNPWNENAEPGDIMVSHTGRAWRLYQSSGWGKRNLGELSMREIKKPGKYATIEKGKLVWVAAENQGGQAALHTTAKVSSHSQITT